MDIIQKCLDLYDAGKQDDALDAFESAMRKQFGRVDVDRLDLVAGACFQSKIAFRVNMEVALGMR